MAIINSLVTKSQVAQQPARFLENYMVMDQSKKWTIKRSDVVDKDVANKEKGVVVEDTVHEHLRGKGQEYLETPLLACCVMDMQKQKGAMQSWFGEEVFKKIRDRVVYSLPEIPADINTLIDSFDVNDESHITDLSKVHLGLEKRCARPSSNYTYGMGQRRRNYSCGIYDNEMAL